MTATLMVTREDWTQLRTLDGLAQTAGAPAHLLRRVVLKELVDNAADAVTGNDDASVQVELPADGSFIITDTGPGIAGSPEQIAALFSIRRPLTSSKLLRLPTRGALGNGLRVVAGAVLVSGGALEVATSGYLLALQPNDDGTTSVASVTPCPCPGTRVRVWLGPAIAADKSLSRWARALQRMAYSRDGYRGKTSPHWYTAPHFWELLQAAGDQPVRAVLEAFDGLAGTKARGVVLASTGLAGRTSGSLSREEAARLLTVACSQAAPVKPERLGRVGEAAWMGAGYGWAGGVSKTHIPYLVEVWADRAPAGTEDMATLYVNRSPALVELKAHRGVGSRGEIGLFGAQLHHRIPVGVARMQFTLNITTPFMPITSQGKEPDLSGFVESIADAVTKAARKANKQRVVLTPTYQTKKDAVIAHLPEAMDQASGAGQYRYSLRQLFYAMRPLVAGEIDGELSYERFCTVVTEHEEQSGSDLAGMYRDNRGTLYHPHTGEDIPLGTLSVEDYQRPAWTFNKVLYCEKEGFFPLLKAVQWPERHDCALLTSKGFASRAARDVIDLLGDTGEPLTFYAIHDADGYGTMIYQALQQATRARPSRRVEILNLGLEPDEAVAMQLEIESFGEKDKAVSVADYVQEPWRIWLQTKRVELNAMSSPQFLEWLDRKMVEQNSRKVIPPQDVLAARVEEAAEEAARAYLTERILREADVDAQVAALLEQHEDAIAHDVEQAAALIAEAFAAVPAQPWHVPLTERWQDRFTE